MFLAIKEQVPVTLALIRSIKERKRRGGDDSEDRQQYWQRFKSQVMDPYLDGLIAHFSENKTLAIMSDLSSKYEEFGVLYPTMKSAGQDKHPQ
ncbi:hypothetical protein JOB18_034725 [Solea senegalensis]|uniref:Uncharacterized protein n=1 Tax=Solea senegalensis TaxID=28829 RepID=A0AAV6S5I9_SOLSE|nr:hypothetical protein JOB18_034725 [Solea senegalensis]